MKINIDHAEMHNQLLIFLSQEPDIAKRKTETYFVKAFCKIIIRVATVSIFKSKIHDTVLVIIKGVLQF